MSGQNESDTEGLRRLQAELAARDEEVEQLRAAAARAERKITDLTHLARHESEHIDQLQEDAVASQRIERAQRALIAELRAEVGEEERAELELGARLHAAEVELVDLRAIRDALLPPTLVQRVGMSIAEEVIPAEPYVGGDFFFVGDGPRGTVVAAVGDAVGKGLQAARRSAFTRTALASVAAFSDDPGRLLQWVNVERIGESAEFVTAACVTYDPGTRVLRFASAGHPLALRLESGDELTAARTGAALGLALEVGCRESAERLGAGDGVLLYTDGLVEARGVESRYGTNRLGEALRHGKSLVPQEILELLKRSAGVRGRADRGRCLPAGSPRRVATAPPRCSSRLMRGHPSGIRSGRCAARDGTRPRHPLPARHRSPRDDAQSPSSVARTSRLGASSVGFKQPWSSA